MQIKIMSASRGSRKRRLSAALVAMGVGSSMFVLGPAYADDPDGSPSAPASLLEGGGGKQTPASAKAAKDGGDGSASVTGDNPVPSVPEPAAAKKRALPLSLDSGAKVNLKESPQAVAKRAKQPAKRQLARKVPAVPASAKVWGNRRASAKALVLYDTHGEYKQLGEYYALGTGMLASHEGSVTALPVSEYKSGLAGRYTAVMYVGSNYDEPLPRDFIEDVLTGDAKVLWSGFNIWQLAKNDEDRQAFIARFGWDPSTSYIDSLDKVSTVNYKSQELTRSADNTSGIIAPNIVDKDKVEVLAQANCKDQAGKAANCQSIAQTTGSQFPWAVRSSGLTYIGEIALTYINETDRYLAYADIVDGLLSRDGRAPSRKAAIRIEDVNPNTEVDDLKPLIDYLVSEKVPFQIAAIPYYVDSNGVYNNGQPMTKTFDQNPELLNLLKYAQRHGGTIVQHGTTHQYGKLNNPYNGVSGDDFEFYRSWCTVEQGGGTPVECKTDTWVQLAGPVPSDSVNWAANRVSLGKSELKRVGLGRTKLFETPHYAASWNSYLGMKKVYSTRYERELFFPGMLNKDNAGNKGNFGLFYPYTVKNIYGTKVLPENLGNYEPESYNNHPPRSGADLVNNAKKNLVVTDGNASFFFHPDYPLSELKVAVKGIKELGYTFTPATGLN